MMYLLFNVLTYISLVAACKLPGHVLNSLRRDAEELERILHWTHGVVDEDLYNGTALISGMVDKLWYCTL